MKQIAVLVCLLFLITLGASADDETDTGWPREISNHEQITIYEPQVEHWKGNRLEERAAVSVQTPSSAEPVYGVIWLNARTEVDKTNHMVTLEDVRISRASFPSRTAESKNYLALVRKSIPSLVHKIALDRLEASLAITRAESGRHAPALNNTPPQIFYSNTPAVLVMVDGDPVLRDTGVSGFLRVINTRALIVFNQDNGRYYLYLGNRWMQSPPGAQIRGQWAEAKKPPPQLNTIKQAAVQQKVVNLLDQPGSQLMNELNNHVIPQIYVATGAADLIQTQGKPELRPLAGTGLLYVENTQDNIFLNPMDQSYYVLLSGRWYRSKTLGGPWLFVSPRKLPTSFAKIPEANPKGSVLASVAGTPQAQEAGIANEVPQTATVNRDQAHLNVTYDGPPQWKPIVGTPLSYAINTRTPVIEIDPHSFYAVENGVWFAATSPSGPWVVATQVPAVIYSIPPSSPLYYVTYVQVYGYTPEVVYDGYTPGYLGSYNCSDGVVVFGTGYWYTPWVGTFWAGPPLTFGFGWYWGVGFGWGLSATTAFFPWWGPWWNIRPGPRPFVVNANIYRAWNHSVVRNTWDRNTIATRAYSRYGADFNTRPNNLYARSNGHVYRYNGGQWQEHGAGGWHGLTGSEASQANQRAGLAAPGQVPQDLNQSRMARNMGNQRWNSFRGGMAGHAGGFGGDHVGGRGGGRFSHR